MAAGRFRPAVRFGAAGLLAHDPQRLAAAERPGRVPGELLVGDVGVVLEPTRRLDQVDPPAALPDGELGPLVEALEQQYDAFQRAESTGANLLAADEDLPTGEDLGRQFEQFLAGLDDDDDQR